MIRRYIRVTGLVQGVGFRWFSKQTASRLGVTGRVRNRSDGSVELEAQGNAAAVEEFINAVTQGPRFAQVDDVEVRSMEVVDERGFHAADEWD